MTFETLRDFDQLWSLACANLHPDVELLTAPVPFAAVVAVVRLRVFLEGQEMGGRHTPLPFTHWRTTPGVIPKRSAAAGAPRLPSLANATTFFRNATV